MNIRPASVADLDGILICMREAFAPYRVAYTPEAFDDTVPSIESMEERLRTMTVLVAVDQHDEVIGTIACSVITPEEGHLRGMAVRPSWQGKGVAPALMAAAESTLLGAGCTRVTLDTTRVLERAMAFYRSVGYRGTGRITDFFGMDLIGYAKDLSQR